MAVVELGTVQPKEAIAHIRQKIGIPSKRFDQYMGSVQAKAFTVAGATKANLVNDFHQAIIAAKENGEAIGQFRKRFDKIVDEHGWSYKGKRGWRTRTIYDNNMRSAAMAGRWQQIQRVKKARPYLIYYTVGDSAVRPQHQEWHAIALPVDDPFWDTHYPPNGWGCRCFVITATEKQLKRLGIKVVEAPEIKTTSRVNTRTGEDYGEVPAGIDTGWNFNVGKAWLGPDSAFGETLVKLPRPLRKEIATAGSYEHIDKAFKVWANDALSTKGRGEIHTVGWLDHTVMDVLEDKGETLQTAAITITDQRLRRMLRPTKTDKGIAIAKKTLLDLPKQIRNASAVLRDNRGGLIFVIDGDNDKKGKVVVYLNFKERGELTNSIRSAGTELIKSLKNKGRYQLLRGEL